jgi:hypothetical protein
MAQIRHQLCARQGSLDPGFMCKSVVSGKIGASDGDLAISFEQITSGLFSSDY